MPSEPGTAPEAVLSKQLRDAISQLLDPQGAGPQPEDIADALWIAGIAGIAARRRGARISEPADTAPHERLRQQALPQRRNPSESPAPPAATEPRAGTDNRPATARSDGPAPTPAPEPPATTEPGPAAPVRADHQADAPQPAPAQQRGDHTRSTSSGAAAQAIHRPPGRVATGAALHPIGGSTRATGGSPRSAHEVTVTRPSALTETMTLARALRPLRQPVHSARPTLDEAGTAQASSQTGLLHPVWRPADERRFSVDLLVDTGATMAVWHHLAGELWTALERHAAFADVRCFALDTDGATPRLTPFHRRLRDKRDTQGSRGRWDSPLDGPSARRILLLLTDGVGRAWHEEDLPGTLARLCRTRPTAALQVLPRRLWHRTALRTVPVQARLPDPARPVPVFRTRDSWSSSAQSVKGWLPVMELKGAWLAPWAELVAGRTSDGVGMLAAPLDGVSGRPRSAPPSSHRTLMSAGERVARFRAGCSPNAYRLACYLAAAPLSLPVMQLVQAATVPGSGHIELAEIFLSGLIERRHAEAEDPDDVVYDFRRGVRSELLGELTRRESVRILEDVLAKVSGHIAATFGGTLDFRALAAHVSGADAPGRTRQLPERSLPFAEVATLVLSDAAGRHEVVARQLAAAIGGRASLLPHPEFLTEPVPIGPADPPHLIGRAAELQALEAAFQQTGPSRPALVVIEGLPGMGRTRLIQEYLRRNNTRHSFAHGIDAHSPETLHEGLAGLWAALGMPAQADNHVSEDRLWTELAGHRDWFIVLEDVPPTAWPRPNEGRDILPRCIPPAGRGCVVATTDALKGWQHPDITIVRLRELGRHEILDHLRRSLGDRLRRSDPYQQARLAKLADSLPTTPQALAAVDLPTVLDAAAGPPRPRKRILRTDGTQSVWAVTSFTTPTGSTLLATGNQDGTVRLWDPETGDQVRSYSSGLGGPVMSITVFALAGQPLLATTGKDRTVQLLDPATGAVVGRLTDSSRPTAPGPLRAVTAFELHGRVLLASAGEDRLIQIWDPATGRRQGELTGHTASVQALTSFLSPDGRPLLATAGHDRTVRIWDPETGDQLGAPLIGHTRSAWAVAAFRTSDGRAQLASAGLGQTVRVWDTATHQLVRTLDGHTASIWAVTAFTAPDGRPLLATAGHDRTVRIWDPETGDQLGAPLTGHTQAVLSATAFTAPDGRPLLATAGHDRTVRIWDVADHIRQ
ncbi:SAV_2336 N-terminal domain-related protein [Streptomyces sp. NPDC052101]|uniref:SAV_2336 N-terminal domain-related protein n=1 Tax=Streptomyces sp. NPDC052101 TaxID=3155763 RepID=UPI00342E6882